MNLKFKDYFLKLVHNFLVTVYCLIIIYECTRFLSLDMVGRTAYKEC